MLWFNHSYSNAFHVFYDISFTIPYVCYTFIDDKVFLNLVLGSMLSVSVIFSFIMTIYTLAISESPYDLLDKVG